MPRTFPSFTRALLGRLLVASLLSTLPALGLGACAAVDGDGVRRQRPIGDDVHDRAFLSVRWKKVLRHHGIFTYEPEEHGGAASSDGGRRVYIGTGSGKLYAFESEYGRLLWETQLGGAVTSRPLVVQHLGMLYVGAADGAIHALDLKTGKRHWLYKTKGIPYRPPVYADGAVFFTNHRDQLFSLAAKTGRWRWSYDRETPQAFTVEGHSGATVVGSHVLAGFSDGTLVCLDRRSGATQWTRSLAGDAKEYVDVDTTPVVRDGVVYAASVSGGVHAVMLEGGALRWRYPAQGASGVAVGAPGDDDGRIYFASAKLGLHALDKEGHLRWRQYLDAGTPSTPILRGRGLYITYSIGGLFVVDRRTGRLVQRFNPGGGVSGALHLTRDSLYLLTNRGNFYAFTRR